MHRLNVQCVTFLLIILFLFCSCSSMSSLQTARVTKKGKFGGGLGLGYLTKVGENSNTFGNSFPNTELNVRYGVASRLDVGLEIGLTALLSIDIKYQFIGNDSSLFACSAGVGCGLDVYQEKPNNGISILLPLYVSYHPKYNTAFYMSPRVLTSY